MSLCDPTEEYSHHTWGTEHHVRLVAMKREQSCTQPCRVFDTITPNPHITELIEAEDQSHLQNSIAPSSLQISIQMQGSAGACL